MISFPCSVQRLVESTFLEELVRVFFKWAGATLIFCIYTRMFCGIRVQERKTVPPIG